MTDENIPTPDLTALLEQANWDVKQADCHTVADVRVALIQAGHNFIYSEPHGVAVDKGGVLSVWSRDHNGEVTTLTNLEPAVPTEP